jgi:hypothetical protein
MWDSGELLVLLLDHAADPGTEAVSQYAGHGQPGSPGIKPVRDEVLAVLTKVRT